MPLFLSQLFTLTAPLHYMGLAFKALKSGVARFGYLKSALLVTGLVAALVAYTIWTSPAESEEEEDDRQPTPRKP